MLPQLPEELEASMSNAVDPQGLHAELLAIHQAVMSPMDVVISDSDTVTLKMVKWFILRARQAEHDLHWANEAQAKWGEMYLAIERELEKTKAKLICDPDVP